MNKLLKITFIFILALIIAFVSGCNLKNGKPKETTVSTLPPDPVSVAEINSAGITLSSRAVNNSFYIKDNSTWRRTYLKGVNMGLTLPTTDLNNPNISYAVYMDWFKQIAAMNANTIKVFTIMNPNFYNALYDYNANNTSPLYILQGVWFNENYMYDIGDAYGKNGKILSEFKKATNEITDIINGNMKNYTYGTQTGLEYKKDVSKYVVGFVLGLEYPPAFINTTNQNNPLKASYNGKYLYTKDASPFESFLCEVGDNLISHESTKYLKQHPVAFLNWMPNDTITHTNEPFKDENDGAVLNTENVKATGSYYAGLFAAVDVYPYYPDFMNYQKEYLSFIENGRSNTYRAYLRDLHKQYTIPIIVAEFGVPTSRGMAHESVMGYNQGFIDEVSQGKFDLKMMQDINIERYAGGMIFSWQDEWFKQVWNTFKYAPDLSIQRGSNVQSAEQFYGILAYDPGSITSICYPDGDISEWSSDKSVFSNDSMDLYIKTDERYLYIMAKMKGQFNFDQNSAVIALNTTGRGNTADKNNNLTFQTPTDFVVYLNGKNNSHIYVDAYYDYFYYANSVAKNVFPRNKNYEVQNSGIFNPIKMLTSNEMYLPDDKKTIPPKAYETGILKFGNANPGSADYNSLSDFYYQDGNFEIRIPWYLLNIYDPANTLQADDFYKAGGVSLVKSPGIYIGGAVLDSSNQDIKMSKTTLIPYTQSTFHARLKKSYDILKDGLKYIS